jgi:hypothetical protein
MGATKILLITPETLRQNTVVNDNTDEKVLFKSIRTAEDKFIRPLVGSNLYNTLLAQVTGNTLAGYYKTLMDDYLIPCLFEYAVLEYLPWAAFKIKDKGPGQQGGGDFQPASMQDLASLKEDIRQSAQFYADAMIRYLRANAERFPEYYQYASLEDIPPATDDYFSGIQFTDRTGRGGDWKDRFEPLDL